MSIEAAVYDILRSAAGVTSLVGGSVSPRIYPVTIPQGKAMPAIVYQQIVGTIDTTCDGDGDLRTDGVQVTCWDDDPDGARTLAEAVRTALQAASGSHGSSTILYCSIDDEGDASVINEQNETLTRYGKRQDWEIAYR
jgi:hypothetical protein